MSALWKLATAPRTAGVVLFIALFVPMPSSTLASQVMSARTPWAALWFVSALVALVVPRPAGRKWMLISLLGVLLAISGLALKLGISASTELGFRGCYQIESPMDPEGFRDGSCEATYDWFRPEGGSRFDPVIAFGSLDDNSGFQDSLRNTNWNLSAINHVVYGYFDWDPRLPVRERLPLTVYWAGETQGTDPIVVTYVGEGVIQSGDQTIPFVPTYTTPNSVLIENRTDSEIFLQYTWRPPQIGIEPSFAAIAITDLDGDPIQPAVSVLVHALLAIAATMMLGSALIIWVLVVRVICAEQRNVQRGRVARITLIVAVVLWALSLIVMNRATWGPAITCVLLLTTFILAGIFQTRAQGRILAAATIGLTTLVGVFGSGTPWYYVPVIRGGDDFLAFESFAREIMITGDLRAGEDVFRFAPGIRYSLAILHFMFGDGNSWIWVASLVAILAAAWLAVDRFLAQPLRQSRASAGKLNPVVTLIGMLGALGLAILIGSDVVWRSGIVMLSEFPTWPALAIALILALTSRGKLSVLACIGLLLGFALTHRSNQLIGVGVIAVVALVIARESGVGRSTVRHTVAQIVALAAPLLAVAALIPLHNWIYGGRLVLNLDPQVARDTTVVQPAELLRDTEAWLLVWRQVRGLLLIPTQDFPIPYDASLAFNDYASAFSQTGWAARVIQAALLLAIVAAMIRVPGSRWRDLLLLAVPAGFLLPHVFLNLATYYPRHTIAGYLTLTIALMAISSRWLLRELGSEIPGQNQRPAKSVRQESR